MVAGRERLERPKTYNDHNWLLPHKQPEVEQIPVMCELEAPRRYYGPKPMIIDSTSLPPTQPMEIDPKTTGFYTGPKPMVH